MGLLMDKPDILGSCRVLDLADEKGLFCPRLLADMGAEVIRVEKPGTPATQNHNNARKHTISLNIATKKGCDLLRRLVKETDVLVESFPPGYLNSLGTGLYRIKPG